MDLAAIEETIRRAGFTPRGAFHPGEDDGVPPLAHGRTAGTLVLAGNAGPAMWRAFAASDMAHDGKADALDRWTRTAVESITAGLGATALFPFGGPPYNPFQRWAQRAEAVFPSPIGPLIHPDYGLWHAYRGALAFAEKLDLATRDDRPSPCESCAERPCLATCPVGAFTGERYMVKDCARYLATEAGEDCMTRSCRARRACPIGRDYTYGPEQSHFHMEAFRKSVTRQ